MDVSPNHSGTFYAGPRNYVKAATDQQEETDECNSTFKVGSAELAFAEGHQKEAHWSGPLLTSLWGQQGPGHFQPMCYISGPVKRRMGRTGHRHRGTIRDAVVPAPETLYAA